jgi:hypothetical protein
LFSIATTAILLASLQSWKSAWEQHNSAGKSAVDSADLTRAAVEARVAAQAAEKTKSYTQPAFLTVLPVNQ